MIDEKESPITESLPEDEGEQLRRAPYSAASVSGRQSGDGQSSTGGRVARAKKETIIEHSYAMRVAAFAMIISVITGACMYANTIPAMTCLYLWLAGMGIFLSYRYRVERPIYVSAIPFVGAVIVIGFFVTITFQQILNHNVNFLIPFLQVLAGLQALHCFDLRTREDFSIAILIALGVFTFTAAAANDYLFLFLAVIFILSLSFLLYFDAVSRSQEVGPSRPVGEGRPLSLPIPIVKRSTRAASVAILLPIICVPMTTLLLFYAMPRSDSIIEWMMRDVVGPYFAMSNSSRGTGANPNVNRPGPDPLGIGKGGNQPGGKGAAGKGKGNGSMAGGDPEKGISPLGRKDSKDDSASGIAGQPGSASESDYEETVENKPEKVDLLDTSEPPDTIVMRINSPRPGYAKRTTYDAYDGKTWRRTGPIAGISFKKDRGNVFAVGNANALLVPDDCPTVEVRQQITVDTKSIGEFLPCFWIPQAVGGKFDRVTVQADGALKASASVGDGATYEVVSLLPVYKINNMRNLPLRTRSHFKESILGPSVKDMEDGEEALLTKYLQLPKTLPDKVKKLAVKVAGDKGNWFVRAERIANYLRKKCKYKIHLENRPKDGDFVYNFLYKTREGNCLEFSSAFVVMCRAAGIPARCVGGYLPGEQNKKTGFYEIKVKHGHAWGEIYVPDWSWIPFDATPVGSYPEVEVDENVLSKLADLGFSNPFGGVLSTPTSSLGAGLGKGIAGSDLDKKINKEKAGDDDKAKIEDASKNQNIFETIAQFKWEPVAFVFILMASGYVAYIYYSRKKEENLEHIPENARQSTLIYLELLNDLKRYRIVRLPSDSPGDLQLRINSALEISREEGQEIPAALEPMLAQFMEVYNKERFGRVEKVDELETMSKEIKQLVKSSRSK